MRICVSYEKILSQTTKHGWLGCLVYFCLNAKLVQTVQIRQLTTLSRDQQREHRQKFTKVSVCVNTRYQIRIAKSSHVDFC